MTQPQDLAADVPTGARGTQPVPGGPPTARSEPGSIAPAPPASGPGGPGPAFSEGSPAAPSAHETLADLGEWELIRRLGCFAPPGQFADDAALLPAGESAGLVVNTDVLVEGLHFSEATTEPGDVGWRAAAANLSDLAAMGCTEVVGLTVGLVAPASTPWAWVEGVYGGLRQALDAYGGVVLGGDCSGGGQRILAITAIGRLAACTDRTGETTADRAGVFGTTAAAMEPGSSGWAVIRRGDGRPGDLLVCTGPHGLSRLGLALLQGAMPGATAAKAGPPKGAAGAGPSGATVGTDDPAVGTTAATTAATGPASETDGVGPWIDPDLRERAIAAHRRPRPRFDAVGALIGCRPAGEPWRVGGCDSSDGLAAAVAAIAASSGCGALLNPADLPLDRAMAELDESEAWCLGGGEDFELVLALAPVWAEALVACLPGSRVIGGLVAGAAGTLGWSDGRPWPQGSSGIGGFRHFG